MDGTFSSVNVKIKECEDDGKLISISVENVLNSKKSVEHFLKNIFPKVVNNKEEHAREKAMFYNCVKNIFCHLGKNVILQMDYKEMVEDDPTENVSCTSLRMGATTTWHGYPDGRLGVTRIPQQISFIAMTKWMTEILLKHVLLH